MNKDAYYFPHFSNARSDRKILRLRRELQIEGYGIYFMLLEVLRDTPNYKYPMDDIDLLAVEFNTSDQKVRTVICNYGLFEVDESNNFFSIKFTEYLQPYLKMKEQRRVAGLASAAQRKLNDRSTTVQQSKVKESKVKESNITPVKSESVVNNFFKELNEHELNQAFEFMFHLGRKEISRDDIKNFWIAFKTHKPESVSESRGKQMQHFRDWLKFQKKAEGKKLEQPATVYNIDEQIAKYK